MYKDHVIQRLGQLNQLLESGEMIKCRGPLFVGVDLGTANIVVVVVDAEGSPVAIRSRQGRAVRDGIVVDYLGALESVRLMKREIEEILGRRLEKASTAIPPGVGEGATKVITNVVEGAGFEVVSVVDEPTAAALALEIDHGAVVDIGGGTTGISQIIEGVTTSSFDEPTGGHHMSLVLAGRYQMEVEKAELMKCDPKCATEVFGIVRPVAEKMATIVRKFLSAAPAEHLHLVGGACSFEGFGAVMEKVTGVPSTVAPQPLLVTPLGIALWHRREEGH